MISGLISTQIWEYCSFWYHRDKTHPDPRICMIPFSNPKTTVMFGSRSLHEGPIEPRQNHTRTNNLFLINFFKINVEQGQRSNCAKTNLLEPLRSWREPLRLCRDPRRSFEDPRRSFEDPRRSWRDPRNELWERLGRKNQNLKPVK